MKSKPRKIAAARLLSNKTLRKPYQKQSQLERTQERIFGKLSKPLKGI